MVTLDGQREQLGNIDGTRGASLTLAPELAAIPGARQQFLHALREAGAPDSDIEPWRLICTEALTNAIRHGCAGLATARVRVEWSIGIKQVSLVIEDPGQGPPADLRESPSLPDDELASSGRGLFIIANLSDRHTHWVSSQGYRQVITRKAEAWVSPCEVEPMMPLEMDSLLDELSNLYESLAAFHRMGAVLNSAEGTDALVREGLRSLELILPPRNGLLKLCLSEHVRPEIVGELAGVEAVVLPGDTPVLARQVLADGESFFWDSKESVMDDSMLRGFHSGCCFPVVAAGKTLGCVIIADREAGEKRRAEEWTNLRAFSDLLGIALANCNLRVTRSQQERAIRELELAAEIQRNLLPILAPPISRHWEIILRHKSAHEVAGDYVEACRDSNGNLVMAIIDVMGKGVSAAMMATLFRNGLHTNLSRSQSLEELIVSINDVLSLQFAEVTMFITCAIVRIDRENTRAEIVNAGHAPVILMNEGRIYRQVNPSGPPLGLFPNAEYAVETELLADFDRLLLVTDGLFEWEIECRGSGMRSWWGWENLLQVAVDTGTHHPDVFWNRVEQLRRVSGASVDALKDDQTMLYWSKTVQKP